MPRLADHAVPSYRKHKFSGQAIVTLGGRDHYLGPHGTKVSRDKYDRLIAEWISHGRQTVIATDAGAIISELVTAFADHAKTHYRREDGTPTGGADNFKVPLRMLRKLYGSLPVTDFGPKQFKAVRDAVIGSERRPNRRPLCRKHVNAIMKKICHCFKWGVENELVPVTVYQTLATIRPLPKNRSLARESTPIGPVPDEQIESTVRYLTPTVAAMVALQRQTGARPGEICSLRPMDVDRSGDTWVYRPQFHKTAHKGKSRTVFLGPKAQVILTPFLDRPSDSYCFTPIESSKQAKARRHAERKTPLNEGNLPGKRQKANPKRKPGEKFNVQSYRKAVLRACKKAGILNWHPNQVRHTKATEVAREHGIEAARQLLGHSLKNTTAIYVEEDLQAAIDAAMKSG
jgi:integrase